MIDLDRLLVLLGVGAVWIICSIGYSRMLRASAEREKAEREALRRLPLIRQRVRLPERPL
jgi:hypothetical protein